MVAKRLWAVGIVLSFVVVRPSPAAAVLSANYGRDGRTGRRAGPGPASAWCGRAGRLAAPLGFGGAQRADRTLG